LGNSVALSKDLISHFPVATVPINSEKISLRYSILVRQYALTKEAYQFHLTLQKNTQQTGSLFDPQPSQLPTNIHCVTNPSEPVVGYVSASSVEEKRIFIKYTEVTQWQYPGLSTDCTLKNTPKDPNDILHFTYPDTSYTLYYFVSGTGPAVIVKKACTYCTYFGGSNMKPSFW
jgi:hypothetical protein